MSPRSPRESPGDPVEQFVHEVANRVTAQSQDASLEALLPDIYDEMRVLAAYLLRGERVAHTLRPTALAHEAYLRLASSELKAEGREHLLAIAARAMRHVLIDYARARQASKRGGGGLERVTLRDTLIGDSGPAIDLLDLHRALDRLGDDHPRKVQVVELLYFAGLTLEEAAAALGLNERTVRRDWHFAKAWLWQELSP
jgi:RNA polymerase sigma-70 factor, ECF subfamily